MEPLKEGNGLCIFEEICPLGLQLYTPVENAPESPHKITIY